MPPFGDYYRDSKKKLKKKDLEKKAQKEILKTGSNTFKLPEVIGRKRTE